MASLETIKAGDEIAVPVGISGRAYSIERVERATATQVVTGRHKWRRKDGRLIGSEGWSVCWAIPVTEQIRQQVQRRELVMYLSGVDWSAIPIEVLSRVKAAFESAERTEVSHERLG